MISGTGQKEDNQAGLAGVLGDIKSQEKVIEEIFDAEIHPERLSSLLSLIIGKPLKVKRMLPHEHRRISEKGS